MLPYPLVNTTCVIAAPLLGWRFASSPLLGELKAQPSDAVNKGVHLALDSDLTALGLAAGARCQKTRL